MLIFPIGTAVAATSFGTIDSRTYKIFEPNNGANSFINDNVLITSFEQMTTLTRKKSSPSLTIQYSYNDIYNDEFRQIEHFVESASEGALTSFYIVDFSRGQTPTNVASVSNDWSISINDTRFYSTTQNQKANHAVVWDGKRYKEGQVSVLSANASITLDINTNNYGSLPLTKAQSDGILYPLYEVYLPQSAMGSFKQTQYWNDKSVHKGFMRTGDLGFVTRYKV